MNQIKVLVLVLAVFAFVSVGFAQQTDPKKADVIVLKPMDATETWKYPFAISLEKKNKLLGLLSDFDASTSVAEMFKRLGEPDRIDDLRKETKPLSHFESGFMAGNKDRFSYRCIWFARKASKSPGLSDSWLAAYVDKDGTTVSIIHENWLKPRSN